MSKIYSLPRGPLDYIAAPKDYTGDNNLGPFTTETVQRYVFGTRNITWDGRVFKYGHAAAECQSGYGAYNLAVVNISANCPLAAVAGDRRLQVTVTSGGYAADGAIAKDELAGGYIVIGNSQEDPINMLIVGNDAAASNLVMVDLEWPLPADIAASAVGYTEIMLNPYAHLVGGITNSCGAKASVMGVPKVNLAAARHGWIQTWGPLWVTPPAAGATAPGYTDNDREVYFVANGSIVGAASGTVIESGFQRAGYVMQRDVAGNNCGPPIIMLQLSI